MDILPGLLLGILLGGGGTWLYLAQRTQRPDPQMDERLRNAFTALSTEVLQKNTAQFLEIAQSKLHDSLKMGEKDLEGKKGLIDKNLEQMKQELVKVEHLMKELEKDREQKFGQLANRLENAAHVTKDLMDTTNSLKQALSGTKSRGQWGERMAEDVLRLAGFVEGINYIKQRQLDASTSRPDFTFMLPQEQKVNMDVKFPFDNYELCINAETDTEREQYKTQFLRDVRNRIKELKDRSYINPEENTVDYVLLFIPNEQVYSFIQESDKTIIDEALKAKTILCSPLTLYAVLAVIRQSIDNFAMEQKSRDMLAHFGTFNEQWVKFKETMETVKARLNTAQKGFEDLIGKRSRALDRPLQKIEELRTERGIDVAVLTPRPEREEESQEQTATLTF